jgi:hypothetical protein
LRAQLCGVHERETVKTFRPHSHSRKFSRRGIKT